MKNKIIKIGAVSLVLLGLIFGVGINANAEDELITNGGFESGTTDWTLSGDFYADSRFTKAHSGSGYAYASNPDGTHGNNLAGWIYQTITIPSDITSATLSFWYNITSQETSNDPHDVLNITIKNSTGNYLATVDVFSNLDKDLAAGNPYYHKKTFDMTPYKGQTVRVHFLATINGTLPTTFRIDDVSITSQAQLPDLVVENIWIEPGVFSPGDTVKIYTRIKNIGNGKAVSDQGLIIRGHFDGGKCYEEGIEGLGAGWDTGDILYWNYNWPSDSDLHNITVNVDPDNYIAESDESRWSNELSMSFSAKSSAGTLDISVSDNPDPFNPRKGETNTIVITNEGNTLIRVLTVSMAGVNRSWQRENVAPGSSVQIIWDGRDGAGNIVSPDTYNYTAVAYSEYYSGFQDTETGTITVLDTPPPPENHPPILSFPETGVYANDGIDPDSIDASTMFSFRIIYTDKDNDMPAFIRVCIEGIETESCNETSDFSVGLDWSKGQELLENFSMGLEAGTYSYYFETSDGMATVRFPETGGFPLIIKPMPTPTWRDPQQVSNTNQEVSHPKIILDNNGIEHAFWIETMPDGASAIFTKLLNNDSGLTYTIETSSPSDTIGNFDMVVDSQNKIHLVWSIGLRTFYKNFSSAGWSSPVEIMNIGGDPSITVDNKDILHVIVFNSTSIDRGVYYLTGLGLEGVVPFKLDNDQFKGGRSEDIAKAIYVDDEDTVHVTWVSERGMVYRKREVGAWQPIYHLDRGINVPLDYLGYKGISIDGYRNHVVVSYSYSGDLLKGVRIYPSYSRGDSFGSNQQASVSVGASSVAVDHRDDIHLMWDGSVLDGECASTEKIGVPYRLRRDQVWAKTQGVSECKLVARQPYIIAPQNGRLYAVWISNDQVYFSTGSIGEGQENQPPNPPTELKQYSPFSPFLYPFNELRAGSEIGDTIEEDIVILEGKMEDPDGDKIKLQIEVRKVDEFGGEFDETRGGLKASDLVDSGGKAHVIFFATSGNYHWRARTIDEHGKYSEWVDFGKNDISDTDFDYGYEPHPYGYKFGNNRVEPGTLTGGVGKKFPKFWEKYIIEGDKWNIFRETFNLEGINKRTQIQLFETFGLNKEDKFYGGSCYGMASSSLMQYVYSGYIDSHYSEFDNTLRGKDDLIWNLDDLPTLTSGHWNGNNLSTKAVLKTILSFQLSQYGRVKQKAIEEAEKNGLDSPIEILEQLKEDLPKIGLPEGKMYILTIGYRKILGVKEIEDSGHALIPYKVKGNKIYVYDDNDPDRNGDEEENKRYDSYGQYVDDSYDQYVEIDRNNNTWRYNALGWPPKPGLITKVDPYIRLLSIDTLYNGGELSKPIGTNENEAVFYLDGVSNLLLTNFEEQRTGFRDGLFVEEIPGIRPIYTFEALPDSEKENPWRQAYYISNDTELTATIEGTSKGIYSLTKFGPGYFADVSDVLINEGNIDNINFSSDSAELSFSKNQEPKTYNLTLNKNIAGISQSFTAVDILTSGSQVHQFTIDWDKLSQGEEGVIMKIDVDGDGKFETEIISDGELTQEEYLSNIPKQIKQSTIVKLESVKGNDKRINRKINSAIKRINKSLEDKLWVDDFHLDPKYGKKVFREEEKAVDDLLDAIKRFKKEKEIIIFESESAVFPEFEEIINEVIQDLIKSDKLLSEIALSEAKNISVEDSRIQKRINRDIKRAEREMERAEKELERGRMDRVIDRLGKAWKYTQKAIKKIK